MGGVGSLLAGRPRRTLFATLVAGALATLPVFLLGGLAVLVQADLGFGDAQLGAATGAFFGAAALSAIPGGRLADRIGARRALLLGAVASAVSLVAIGAWVSSFATLLCALTLGGLAMGVSMPATNRALSESIPVKRRGTAFGIKQTAIPLATLAGGLAVPTLGLTLGWRWAFGLAVAVLPLLVVVLPPPAKAHIAGRRPGPSPRVALRPPAIRRPLLMIAAAGALATASANALGVFFVSSAVQLGSGLTVAGLTAALGSLTGMVGRVAAGVLADRRDGGHLRFVELMLLFGAAGFVLLGFSEHPALLVIATIVSFGAGWGWAGLLLFAVVQLYPASPGRATGIAQAGNFLGGASGPLAFGLLVNRSSYAWAWSAMALSLVVSALLVGAARRELRA
jgi:MFS family permease